MDAGAAVASAPVDLGELVVGAGEADLEAFDLAEPAFALRLGNAGEQAVADLFQARSLRWVWSQQGTPDTRFSEQSAAGTEIPQGIVDLLVWLGRSAA